jgi:hypothetical protein
MRFAAALALAVAALAPPAHATEYSWEGGCHWDFVSVEYGVAGTTYGDHTMYTGYAGPAVVVTSPVPAGVTVTCRLLYQGNLLAATPPVHGTTVVAALTPVTVQFDDPGYVLYCTDLAFDDGPTINSCPYADGVPIVPHQVCPVINSLHDVAYVYGVVPEDCNY